MDIRRTINIFLASSEEMENDRNAFGNLVRRLNGICEKQGIHIELFEWEDYDAAYNGCRKQDEYNEKVRSCDMFLALFHIKAGKWTLEEFDIASEEYRRTGQKPKVYVYCRELSSGEFESEELKNFKTRLFDEMGHYWSVYSNKDSMQLHFVMQLMLLESGGMGKLKVDNGRVMFMDNPIASMDKLRFAAENEDYQRMANRLSELAPLIENARSRVEKYPEDEDFVSDLQKLLNERNKLEEDFDQYQQILLDTAKRISRLQGDRITDRMRRAMEAFEAGKVREANVILDEAERDADHYLDDYMQSREITAIKRDNVIKSIEELMLKASTVMADESIAIEDRISQTTELYAKADKMAAVVDYDKEKYYKLLDGYAEFLSKYGKYNESMAICQRMMPVAEELYGTESGDVASVYNSIGFVCHCLADYDKAMDYFQKALEIRQKVLEEENSDTAVSYNNIGNVYDSLGDYDKALVYYQKSLKIREKIFGDEHIITATSYNNIGSVYYRIGDYNKALEYQDKALKIREMILGEMHPDTATSYNNIGSVYDCMGDYDKALMCQNKAMKMLKNVYGDEHPKIASSYNNIGLVYYRQCDYDKALEYYGESLKIIEKIFAEEHPATAIGFNNIGSVYDSLGEYNRALVCYGKALGIWAKVFGNEHPNTATSYNNIGSVYYRLGDCDKALMYYNRALVIREKILGEEHPDTATSYNNIGLVYDSLCDYDKALEYYNKDLEICDKIYGEEHSDTVTSYNNIGSVYYSLGDYDKALEYYNKALVVREKILGEEHPDTATSYNNIGLVYYRQGDYDKALEYYDKALKIRERVFGEEHEDTKIVKKKIEQLKSKMENVTEKK